MAVSFLIAFFGIVVVYVTERYFFDIPLLVSAILTLLFIWYLMYSFFRLALLDQRDRC